jgi:hypothetical protein
MSKYKPPMYGKVRRKVPPAPRVRPQQPTPTESVLQKQKALQEAVKRQQAGLVGPAAEVVEEKPVGATAKKKVTKKAAAKKVTKKTAAKKKVAKKATKKPAKKKAAKKPKTLKWDDEMTQKELYRMAKDAGLNVRSKDWKSEIIKEIKKYNRKVSR